MIKQLAFLIARKIHINKWLYSVCTNVFDLRDKMLLKKNAELKNKYKGKRCFIVGNGPSISEQDLTLLKREYTFTVNQLSRRKDFLDINSDFHIWTDKRFFQFDDEETKVEMINVIKKCKNNNDGQIVFFSNNIRNFDFSQSGFAEDRIFYIGEDDCYKLEDIKNIDFTKIIPGFSTVIHYAVLLAIYMGFKEIYLLGCDCTGFITTAQAKMKSWDSSIQYGYDVTEIEKNRMEKSNNAFSMENELLFYANIFKRYRELNDVCRRNDVKLYNATKGGLLESIERVNYEELLQRKRNERD